MTAQFGEILIINGKDDFMMSEPSLPGDSKLIKKKHWVDCTACWRGYMGTWEIKNGRLYLNKLKGRVSLKGTRPVFAKWVTETLRVPRGKLLKYVHMGFESIYEKELLIFVINGIVVGKKLVNNKVLKRKKDNKN